MDTRFVIVLAASLCLQACNSSSSGREATPPPADSVDVAVTALSATPNPVDTDATVVYTASLTNNGPADATGVVLTSALPAGVTFVAAGSSGSCAEAPAGTVSCAVGALANGASTNVLIAMTPGVAAAGTMNFSVSVLAAEADNTAANNVRAAAVTVSLVLQSGLDTRPANSTCVAGDRPAPGGDTVQLQRVFPALSFYSMTGALQGPDGRWYVLEQGGWISTFPDDNAVTAATTALDFGSVVDTGSSEGGMLGMAFHPDFQSPDPDATTDDSRDYVYLSFTVPGSPLVSVLARFTMNADRTVINAGSRFDLMRIAQPDTNHNGGHVAFGPDGYLYWGLGDGGDANDTYGNGQRQDTLLAAMLRIDVNVTPAEEAAGNRYKIPPGNITTGSISCPGGLCVADCGTQCPEIFAWGLRNPWKWSFDSGSGDLWVGDVGQDHWEEIDIIQAGNNYGWRLCEGNQNRGTSNACTAVGMTAPVYDYAQAEFGGGSVTGGYVYRGTALSAAIGGAYVYGDFEVRQIWALNNPYTTADRVTLIPNTGFNIGLSAFAQDNAGELYALEYGFPGGIYKLVPGPGATPARAFADQLSMTGCANAANPSLPSSGMIPFDINSPLWSDGATKQRWLAIPDGQAISLTTASDLVFPNGADLDFPVGTVLRKDFTLAGTLIETRLLARHNDGGWVGYSYEWNAAGTDANLVAVTGKDVTNINGSGQNWRFPGESQCADCHTPAAGFALGPEVAQLNRDLTYAATGRTANQLATFSEIGLLSSPLTIHPDNLPALALPDDTGAAIADRARGYLQANCSGCHRPGGGTRSGIDLRYAVSFAAMGVCDQPSTLDDLSSHGVVNGVFFAPMEPARSILSVRMGASQASGIRMPPLGTELVHTAGKAIIDGWITSVMSCPPAP